jgi:hypothetical protein
MLYIADSFKFLREFRKERNFFSPPLGCLETLEFLIVELLAVA